MRKDLQVFTFEPNKILLTSIYKINNIVLPIENDIFNFVQTDRLKQIVVLKKKNLLCCKNKIDVLLGLLFKLLNLLDII